MRYKLGLERRLVGDQRLSTSQEQENAREEGAKEMLEESDCRRNGEKKGQGH